MHYPSITTLLKGNALVRTIHYHYSEDNLTSLIKFERKIHKSGRTLVISFPKEVQSALGLKDGQDAEMYLTEERKIIIEVKGKKDR